MSVFSDLMRAFKEALAIPDSQYPKVAKIEPRSMPAEFPKEIADKQPERDPRDVRIEWLQKELSVAIEYGERGWKKCREISLQNEACWRENQEIKMRLRQAIGELRNELDPEL